MVLQVLILLVAPTWIMPLFNRFTALEEGPLKEGIDAYASQQGFQLQGVYTMDGSRRSSRSNAFFTGLGRWRRVVLYDTLVASHDRDELVAVLAHEIGHNKLRHIPRMIAFSAVSTGVMFFVLSLFLSREGLYQAFGVSTGPVGGSMPIYAGMVFFGLLYAPMNLLLSVVQNGLSRRHEFEADAFAVRTVAEPGAMVKALKRLAVDNLSNLTPHPLKVFVEYSHPPVLERIRAIRALLGGEGGRAPGGARAP
jgi:STE24 endopeptidase